jgi:hypothetical protein
MRLLFKTEYAPRTVVRLVNICNCFSVYDWTAKLIERLPDMTPIGMLLDASVSPEKHKQHTSNFDDRFLETSTTVFCQ